MRSIQLAIMSNLQNFLMVLMNRSLMMLNIVLSDVNHYFANVGGYVSSCEKLVLKIGKTSEMS